MSKNRMVKDIPANAVILSVEKTVTKVTTKDSKKGNKYR